MSSVQSTDRDMRQNVGNGVQGIFADRDAAFTLLSSRRRRNIIHALMQVDGSTVSELARQLAGWETGKAPEAVSSKERKRTYTALRQTHLPKLADHDVVTYDANRGTVSLTERGEALGPYLYVPGAYLGSLFAVAFAAVFSAAVVLALSMAGVSPFAALTGYQLSAVTTAAFGLVTIAAYVLGGPRLSYQRAFDADTTQETKTDVQPADD